MPATSNTYSGRFTWNQWEGDLRLVAQIELSASGGDDVRELGRVQTPHHRGTLQTRVTHHIDTGISDEIIGHTSCTPRGNNELVWLWTRDMAERQMAISALMRVVTRVACGLVRHKTATMLAAFRHVTPGVRNAQHRSGPVPRTSINFHYARGPVPLTISATSPRCDEASNSDTAGLPHGGPQAPTRGLMRPPVGGCQHGRWIV